MTCPGKRVEQPECSPVMQARLTRPMGAYVPPRAVLDSMTGGFCLQIQQRKVSETTLNVLGSERMGARRRWGDACSVRHVVGMRVSQGRLLS